MNPNMHVRAISGAGHKSAACFLVETDGKKFLLDLGRNDDGSLPDISGIGPVDAVFISHCHADHIGGLDLLDALGNPPLFATEITRAFGGHPALQNALPLPLSGKIDIAGIQIDCGRAGHAPGGVWIRIGGAHGVLYSGDYSAESIVYSHEPLASAHTLIVDASYGTHDIPLSPGMGALHAKAAEGSCLLPAPAAGRGIEMALELFERGHSISLCSAHERALELLLSSPATLLEGMHLRLKKLQQAAAPLTQDSTAHGVMIAAAATVQTGLAKDLYSRFRTSGEARIIFTGHIAGEEQRSLVERGEVDMIRWNVHPTLSGLKDLLAQAGAKTILPAFLGSEDIPRFAEACGLKRAEDGWLYRA